MKKLYWLIFGILVSFSASGQIAFQRVNTDTSSIIDFFPNLGSGEIAFADIDSDSDQDALIQGNIIIGSASYLETRIYRNIGNGVFEIDQAQNIVALSDGMTKFHDFDLDGDLDFIIFGVNSSSIKKTLLYLNDGSGNFTESVTANFIGVNNGQLEYFDFDNDGDHDVFLSGFSSSGVISKFYWNDGLGNFTLDITNNLPGKNGQPSSFGDVDGDGDIDIFLTANLNESLYLNDGNGYFSPDPSLNLLTGDSNASCMHDFDGDLDLDLLVFGNVAGTQYMRKFVNNGSGFFVWDTLGDISISYTVKSITAHDFNSDGQPDLMISGSYVSPYFSLYLNHPTLDSFIVASSVIEPITARKADLVDLNNDSNLEIVFCGNTVSENKLAVYTKNLSGNYIKVNESTFGFGMYDGAFDTGDIDNDGDKDIIAQGLWNDEQKSISFINEGMGVFSKSPQVFPFCDVWQGDSKFFDINNDAYLDVLISGLASTPQTFFHINDGAGNFSYASSVSVNNLKYSAIDTGDVDNDGDLDFVIIGRSGGSGTNLTAIYLHNGTDNYTLQPNNLLIPDMYDGDVKLADIDGDNDLDLFLCGVDQGGSTITELLLNDGNGNFYDSFQSFAGSKRGGMVVADFDGDADLDIIIAGYNQTNFYKNNSTGVFMLYSTIGSTVNEASIAHTDVEGDGDLDIVISGKGSLSTDFSTHLYLNNGLGDFSVFTDPLFESVAYSNLHFFDFDNDNDEDLLLSGIGLHGIEMILYENTTCIEYFIANYTVCAGENLILTNGDTLWNLMADTSFYYNVTDLSGCDSIYNTLVNVISINDSTSHLYNEITSYETINDSLVWYNCDSSNVLSLGNTQVFHAGTTGNYACIIYKSGCIDTSDCIEIDTQDYYDDPSYIPLFGEVFPYQPTSDIDSCDGIAIGYAFGGVEPYSFDWLAQINNIDSIILEYACYGIYSLKITDAIGDNFMVDYYLPDSNNYDTTSISGLSFTDTIYVSISNCLIDFSSPLDTFYISNMIYLNSIGITDNYEMTYTYSQNGTVYNYQDTVGLNTNNDFLFVASIYCPSKSVEYVHVIMGGAFVFQLGINQHNSDEIKIYPVPSDEFVFIQDASIVEGTSFKVIDLSGKTIYEAKTEETGIIHLNTSEFVTGTYFVILDNFGSNMTYQIIKL